jgi:SAM-dependent methyltransferase
LSRQDSLVLSPDAVELLLLQRTHYRTRVDRIRRRLNGSAIYRAHVARHIDRVRARGLARRYEMELSVEFETIRPHLPPEPPRILDVGCGLAGIDVLISRFYEPESVELWLLDRNAVEDRVWYGFEERGAAYSRFDATASFLSDNGVDVDALHMIDIDTTPWPSRERFDVVISLISWGFHYPVSTYLDAVADTLHPDGVVILDVRDDSGGFESLQSRFAQTTVVQHFRKHSRVAAYYPITASHSPRESA